MSLYKNLEGILDTVSVRNISRKRHFTGISYMTELSKQAV